MAYSTNSNRVTYIQITSKCNATCLMCHIWKKPQKDMALSRIIKLLDLISIFFPNSEIRLTGGEACLHNHFAQVINEIDKRSFRKSIITNGSLFSLMNIEKMNFDRVFLSLDSPLRKDQLHIRGLELILPSKTNIDIIANVIVSKLNQSIVEKIPEWLIQNGIGKINIIPMKGKRYSLSNEEFDKTLRNLIFECEANKISHFVEGLEFREGINSNEVYYNLINFNPEKKCKIKGIVRFIDLNEIIYSCNSMPHRSYSLPNNEFNNCCDCPTYNSKYCDLSNIIYNSLT